MENLFTFREFSHDELLNISVGTLAWVGDAVYTLCAREYELAHNQGKPNQLHKMATCIVNAEAQSEALSKITPILSEIEAGVVRRAKNSPITTKSKHYGLAEYKRATGFEALLGYLYLSNNRARLNEILAIIFDSVEVEK